MRLQDMYWRHEVPVDKRVSKFNTHYSIADGIVNYNMNKTPIIKCDKYAYRENPLFKRFQ